MYLLLTIIAITTYLLYLKAPSNKFELQEWDKNNETNMYTLWFKLDTFEFNNCIVEVIGDGKTWKYAGTMENFDIKYNEIITDIFEEEVLPEESNVEESENE